MVPVAQAARFPPLLSCCESADDSPSGQMLRDRAAYTAAVACAAARPQPALPYPGEGYEDGSRAAALAAMRRAQTGQGADYRAAFLESVKSEAMLSSLAAAGWALPYATLHED